MDQPHTAAHGVDRMKRMAEKDRTVFELMLIVVAIGMTYLVYEMGAYKMVALNLFFLPIVLSGYYLGRTSAGVLALFCVLAVTIATIFSPTGVAAYNHPVMIGLAITVWGAVLGLTAILVGTLCDERAAKVNELQDAYVGVVEITSRYLQSGDPRVKAKSIRVAELCHQVAQEMRLSRKQMDDIRVGALLHDLGNLEVTTKLISKAMDSLESRPAGTSDRHTFLGMDLVHSLGSVLHGAVPLLLSQDDALHDVMGVHDDRPAQEIPIGARIIRAVRAYDEFSYSESGTKKAAPQAVLARMGKDPMGEFDPEVLSALESVVARGAPVRAPEEALV